MDNTGYTYLIQQGECLKIGYTTDVKKRLRQYRTHNVDFKLLYVLKGNEEKELHNKFSKFKFKNEWFNFDDEIVKYFENNSNKDFSPLTYDTVGNIKISYLKALYMFDPIHCSPLFIYLMGETELGTNRVNINCKDLIKTMSCSKNTIYRCLDVLKKSYTLLEHDGYWVINPILFFKGNKTQRYELYVKLGRPGFYVSPEMLRKEFHNEEKLIL